MEVDERTAPMAIDYKGEDVIVVTLFIPKLQPKSDKNDYEIKNGEADVTFNNRGFGMDAKIRINESKNKATVWKRVIREFPSKIDYHSDKAKSKSYWRVEKNRVIITLTKKKDPKETEFVDWRPLVEKNTLDQYREKEDEEEEAKVFDPQVDTFPTTFINIRISDSNQHQYGLVARKPP